MTAGPEFALVEEPFLTQFASMGWKVVTGSVDHPSFTGRESFREVLIRPEMSDALRRINLRDGGPWLDDARIAQTLPPLDRFAGKQGLRLISPIGFWTDERSEAPRLRSTAPWPSA